MSDTENDQTVLAPRERENEGNVGAGGVGR